MCLKGINRLTYFLGRVNICKKDLRGAYFDAKLKLYEKAD